MGGARRSSSAWAFYHVENPSDTLPTIDSTFSWSDIAPGDVFLLDQATKDGSAVQEVNDTDNVLADTPNKTPLLSMQEGFCPDSRGEFGKVARLDWRVQVGVDGGKDVVDGDDAAIVWMRRGENVDWTEVWVEERGDDAQVLSCGRSGRSACFVCGQTDQCTR